MSQTKLDFPQVIKQAFDESNQALRMTPASATVYNIQTNALDGDSQIVYGSTDGSISGIVPIRVDSSGYLSGSIRLSANSSGESSSTVLNAVVISPMDCSSVSNITLYATTNTAISGIATYSVQVSPASAGSTFASVTSLNAPAAVGSAVTIPVPVGARRVQLIMSSIPASGTCQASLIGK